MTERPWDAVRRVALELERRLRDRTGSGEDGHLGRLDLVLLLAALALPTDDGPPRRPDTWITVRGCYAWWVSPEGEADPDRADVWLAVLEEDGQPDYANALKIEDVENWEGFPWEGRSPTARELRTLKAQVIGALGFLSAGPPWNEDPLTAADAIRAHVTAVRADMGNPGNTWTGGDASDGAFERSQRGGLGGISGDMAAAFHPGLQLSLADLLTAVATSAPADTVRRLAESIGRTYLETRTRDDHRTY